MILSHQVFQLILILIVLRSVSVIIIALTNNICISTCWATNNFSACNPKSHDFNFKVYYLTVQHCAHFFQLNRRNSEGFRSVHKPWGKLFDNALISLLCCIFNTQCDIQCNIVLLYYDDVTYKFYLELIHADMYNINSQLPCTWYFSRSQLAFWCRCIDHMIWLWRAFEVGLNTVQIYILCKFLTFLQQQGCTLLYTETSITLNPHSHSVEKVFISVHLNNEL